MTAVEIAIERQMWSRLLMMRAAQKENETTTLCWDRFVLDAECEEVG